ncbi:hydrogenase expression/formation protein HypE [Candidatus Hodarchaeum mangrovi]
MGHGGKKMDFLIEFIANRIAIKKTSENALGVEAFDDGAIIPFANQNYNIVVTTDSYTVTPIFFRGGNIGTLAISGTINDLLMMGAKPIAITLALIIREGFSFQELGEIIKTISDISSKYGIAIVAGDTKVMPRTAMNEVTLIINTTGFGVIPPNMRITDSSIKPGDKIISTGTLGDHGFAMLAIREGIELETTLESDVAPLIDLILPLLKYRIHAMKDPTRGGLASVLNEWAKKSAVSIWLEEATIPVKEEVRIISEIFGIDPLLVSNEGKAILAVHPEDADKILNEIKRSKLGKKAAIIGEAKSNRKGQVLLKTRIGGHRILDKPVGEPIPRVC